MAKIKITKTVQGAYYKNMVRVYKAGEIYTISAVVLPDSNITAESANNFVVSGFAEIVKTVNATSQKPTPDENKGLGSAPENKAVKVATKPIKKSKKRGKR